MRSGRLKIAIAGGNDEVWETVVSAKQVHVTWTDDATMNEDKPCLQRDVTEVDVSRRSAGRTCLMFVVIPRCTMSTEQWWIHGNLCYGGLLRGSQVSCLTRCMRKLRRSTRWLWYGLVDRARCVSRDVTLHRLSVLLIRLVDKLTSR